MDRIIREIVFLRDAECLRYAICELIRVFRVNALISLPGFRGNGRLFSRMEAQKCILMMHRKMHLVMLPIQSYFTPRIAHKVRRQPDFDLNDE